MGQMTAVPDCLCSFLPEAPQGHLRASPGASDGIDASLTLESKNKTEQVWNLNRYLTTYIHHNNIHKSQNMEANQVFTDG